MTRRHLSTDVAFLMWDGIRLAENNFGALKRPPFAAEVPEYMGQKRGSPTPAH